MLTECTFLLGLCYASFLLPSMIFLILPSFARRHHHLPLSCFGGSFLLIIVAFSAYFSSLLFPSWSLKGSCWTCMPSVRLISVSERSSSE